MHPEIRGQFGMEGGDEASPLSNEHGMTLMLEQHVDVCAHASDDGRSDEDQFEGRRAKHGVRTGIDEAINLTPVSVPLNRNIDETERRLSRIGDFFCQQDRSSACAEESPPRFGKPA